MTLIILGVIVVAAVVGLFASREKDECCGVTIAEQDFCNAECKSSPYQK
jgi:hypothetical protein